MPPAHHVNKHKQMAHQHKKSESKTAERYGSLPGYAIGETTYTSAVCSCGAVRYDNIVTGVRRWHGSLAEWYASNHRERTRRT
jgi:hypothetical protein